METIAIDFVVEVAVVIVIVVVVNADGIVLVTDALTCTSSLLDARYIPIDTVVDNLQHLYG